MPYKIFKDGNQWCVKNSETDESKGCSGTRAMALAHMRALYAHEKKDIKEPEIDALVMKACAEYQVENGEAISPEEVLESKGFVVEMDVDGMLSEIYGPTSYAELDEKREAQKRSWKVQEAIDEFPDLARNIISSPMVEEKADAVEELGQELANRVRELSTEPMEDKAISKREDVSEADKKRATGEYGNVTYADERNKKYPLDTEKHIRAAWGYIGMPKNQKKYSPGEVSALKRKIVSAWKRVIDKKGPPANKSIDGIIEQITFVLKDTFGLLDAETSEIDDVEVKEEGNGGILTFKNKNGQWVWAARYSNNFRDDDNPSEIITASSHRRFIDRVEKGLTPYPELWYWHEKTWLLGKATWVGYDDTGFALAAGYYHPGREPIAEALSKAKDIRVSHGMPRGTLVYDENDKSLIVGHDTLEISPLIPWAAANKLTGFVSFNNKGEEVDVSIPKEQKAKLTSQALGITEEMLANLEKVDISDAQKAVEAGIENKEKKEDTTETPTETAPVSTPAPTPEKTEETVPVVEIPQSKEAIPTPEVDSSKEAPTRAELAEALVTFLKPYMDNVSGLQKEVAALKEELATHKTKDDSVAEQFVKSTPLASLMAGFAQRAVGSDAALIKEGDPLETTKGPEQTKANAKTPTGIPFLDEMLGGGSKQP